MHEMSLIRDIVKVACRYSEENGGKRIRGIAIRVGIGRGFHEALLATYFDYFSKRTVAQGATIKMVVSPIRFVCDECNTIYELDGMPTDTLRCEDHPGSGIKLLSGTELMIESITVD